MTAELIAPAQDTATPFSGLFAIESGAGLVEAIESGSWLAGTLNGVSLAIDTAMLVADPIGSAVAMCVGWVLDHIEPLKGWMNDLTGNAGEVAAFAQSWANISVELRTIGNGVLERLQEFDDYSGETVRSYRSVHSDGGHHVLAAADWANGVSIGLQGASVIVQFVHDMVRDAIAEVVGLAVSAFGTSVLTLGLGAPAAIGKVTARVTALASRLQSNVTDLVTSVGKLTRHLEELKELVASAGGAFAAAVRGGGPAFAMAGVPSGGLPGGGRPPKPPRTPPPSAPKGGGDPKPPSRPKETLPVNKAPRPYTKQEVEDALERAPRNDKGQPLDHRTNKPLRLHNAHGRGWVMRYDPEDGTWVAENRTSPENDLAPTGKPDDFGYDEHGNLLPYANHRPKYPPHVLVEVWLNSRRNQLNEIRLGELKLPEPGPNQMYVKLHPNDHSHANVFEADGERYRIVEWDPNNPTSPRDWDMGHIEGHEYWRLRADYLGGHKDTETFLSQYHDADLYQVADPYRNSSHLDELPRDVP